MAARINTFRKRPREMAVLGVAAILLAGCSSVVPAGGGDTPAAEQGSDDVVEQPVEQEKNAVAGLTAEAIIAAAEAEGLECAEEDPRLDGREQLIVCKGADYVIISATRLTHASLVSEQTASAKKALCESGFKTDGTRFAIADTWILSPGGDDDKNVATFDGAMTTLGLDWNLAPC